MLKKTLSIFLLSASLLFSQKPERVIDLMIDNLAKQYSKSVTDFYSKQGCALLPFKNESPLSKKHLVGEAVRSLSEASLDKSLVFLKADRDHLPQIVKEMELIAAGLTKNSANVTFKGLEDIRVFISGTITEVGTDFIVTLNLIDPQSGAIIATEQGRIPLKEMIDLSDQVAFDALAANGIALNLRLATMSPMVWSQSPTAKAAHGSSPAISGVASLSYRVSRNFKVDFGYLGFMNFVYGSETGVLNMRNFSNLHEITNYAAWDGSGKVNTSKIKFADLEDVRPEQRVSAIFQGLTVTGDYVWNLRRNFNLFAGCGINLGSSYFDVYISRIPTIVEGAVQYKTYQFTVYPRFAWGASAEAGMEWFIRPRFSLSVSGSYSHFFIASSSDRRASTPDGARFYMDGAESTLNEAFGLNPFERADGELIDFSFNHFALRAGFSLYF